MVPGTTEVNSNYGYFWNYNNQLVKVIDELKRNKETRRAIVVHYILHEIDRYKYDTPCNDVLNFYIKDDKLHMTVFARSIDLVFGFCNDQYTFAKLMEHVSRKTKYPVGQMHWFITNLHVYPRHYEMFK
jgi:thymidylate synthase